MVIISNNELLSIYRSASLKKIHYGLELICLVYSYSMKLPYGVKQIKITNLDIASNPLTGNYIKTKQKYNIYNKISEYKIYNRNRHLQSFCMMNEHANNNSWD
jgi:hypothetical protein